MTAVLWASSSSQAPGSLSLPLKRPVSSHTPAHTPNLCQRLSAILRVLKNIHFQTPPTVFIKSSPNLILLDYLIQNLCNRCSHIFNEKKINIEFLSFQFSDEAKFGICH